MKHLKMLAVAAVMAGALLAFIGAGSASASVICSTNAEHCPAGQVWTIPQGVVLVLTPGNSARLEDTSGNTLDTCKSSEVSGSLTNAGSATATVAGTVEALTWKECTFTTNTLVKGGLEIHKIAGTSNGTVTSTGTFEVTINSILGDCKYGVTAGTDLGELTGGNPAIFHANAPVKELSSLAACPDTTKWTATYTMTKPAGTEVWVAAT